MPISEKKLDVAALLPCPFCGSKAAMVVCGGYGAECTNPECFTSGRFFDFPSEAVAAWNTRDTKKVDELEAALRGMLNSCGIKPVGGGDGGTFSLHAPSGAAINAARTALNDTTEKSDEH